MAVATRRQTVVNSARKNAGGRRKLSAKQIAAGFGGKRRQSAQKTVRKAARKNNSGPRRAPAAAKHRKRTAPRATRPNLGKIISYSLPKESTSVAQPKKNSGRKATAHRKSKRATRKNTGHRKRGTQRNPSMGDLTGLATSAVFTIAGAVGSKYLTQMVLTGSNTGVMGYLGNLVSAFLLSWGVKNFMKNDRAAAAVLSGGVVQVVLRLINDFTPYGSYVANLGMGDYGTPGLGVYQSQNFLTPQRLVNGLESSEIQTYGPATSGMAGCNDLYSFSGGLYA